MVINKDYQLTDRPTQDGGETKSTPVLEFTTLPHVAKARVVALRPTSREHSCKS